MPITTYIFDKEDIKRYSKIEDKKLRDLRDEIWYETGIFFLIKKYIKTKKKFFKKYTKNEYRLMVHIVSCEYQMLNFAVEDDCSCTIVDKCHIINYFNGMLSALQRSY